MIDIVKETVLNGNVRTARINIHPAAIQMSEDIFKQQMRIEYNLLCAGKIEEYKKCHHDFQNQKIPDFRPGLADLLYGSDNVQERPTISTWNYFFKFNHDKFRNQYDFTEYLSNSFDRLIANPEFLQDPGYITKYTPEYITRYGRCDFFIEGSHPILLELKVDKINRKEIYQCIEYQKSTDYKIPVAIVGHKISDDAKDLAKETDITIYRYNVQDFAPLKVKITHVQGKHHKVIDKMGDILYIFKEWSKYR
jgi:hypothetical protein